MSISLTDQTFEKLIDMITVQKYKPGMRLPSEMQLCEDLNVSRNTLRAALNKLSTLGITESRQGGGTFIRKAGSDTLLNFFLPAALTHNEDLLEIMEFRKGIEVEAAGLAAKNATQEDIEKIRELLEQCDDEKLAEDMELFARTNTDFHYELVKASHNHLYERLMDIIHAMILQEMKDFLKDQGRDIDSVFYHRMIFECIANHRPEEAAFFMNRHLSLVIDRIRAFMERSAEKE